MNILFDFITPQHFIGGAGEYVRKVFYTLQTYINENHLNCTLYGAIDTSINKFAYSDLCPKYLAQKNVTPVDINGRSLQSIIVEKKIDRVFIGALQYWIKYDVNDVSIPIVCVVHDLCDEEYQENRLIDLEKSTELLPYILYKIRIKIRKPRRIVKDKLLIEKIGKNESSRLVTVSEFSRQSLCYHFSIERNKVEVLYSPERTYILKDTIFNETLRDIIDSKKKYYLLLSANRKKKNAQSAIRAFKRYIETKRDDAWLVTVGGGTCMCARQIVLPYLDESDLTHALANCYALVFPSIFEGFGYPPVEAMRFGKPILHSNVTSIPEIVGPRQISFSPFYSSDIYSAFMKLNGSNYEVYSKESKLRYAKVSNRQKEDLKKLIEYITE